MNKEIKEIALPEGWEVDRVEDGKIILKDHSYFDKTKILESYATLNATSLLVTQKDAVKLEEFGLPLSILQLELSIAPNIKEQIKNYIAAN